MTIRLLIGGVSLLILGMLLGSSFPTVRAQSDCQTAGAWEVTPMAAGGAVRFNRCTGEAWVLGNEKWLLYRNEKKQ